MASWQKRCGVIPILHHYEISPFSEKIRLIFGLKGAAWRSVLIPSTLPKPDYVPLTGGYRQTPALQIGADIYCDTRRIAAELERRYAEPTLFPGARGLHEMMATWAETRMFWPAARYTTGMNADALPPEFHADRAAMRGRPAPSSERLRAAGARALVQLRPQISWVADALADGRRHLLDDRPGLADFALYHAFWFLGRFPRNLLEELVPGGPIRAWIDRIAAIGHGARSKMAAVEALDLARDSVPSPLDPGEPLDGFHPGDRVTVGPDDRASPPVEGTIVRLTGEEIALRRADPRVGEVHVHFPRLGYVVDGI